MSTINFLLLSGSPRGKMSTSYSILEYLKTQLEGHGKSCEIIIAHKILRKETDFDNFCNLLDNADYLVLTAPLYVDSLPSHVIEILTRLSERRRNKSSGVNPKFLALVNNGFPEERQNHIALQMCDQFAQEANLDWYGGIPFGGGAIIDGVSLDSVGGRGRHARAAMVLLADALSKNEELPGECISRINKRIIPTRMYIMMAHRGWKRRSESNNVRDRLKDQPYMV